MRINEMKEKVRSALYLEYGFAPTLVEITIHDSNEDGTIIVFDVNNQMYILNDHRMERIMG